MSFSLTCWLKSVRAYLVWLSENKTLTSGPIQNARNSSAAWFTLLPELAFCSGQQINYAPPHNALAFQHVIEMA